MSVLTIRPIGTGLGAAHIATPAVANWNNVKEAIADNGTSYNYISVADDASSDRQDTYSFTARSFTTETINSVKIYIKWTGTQTDGTSEGAYVFHDGTASYENPSVTNLAAYGAVWTVDSWLLTTNPRTTFAWTVAEVNALKAGFHTYTVCGSGGDAFGGTTQMYIEIDYTESVGGSVNSGMFGIM